MKLIDLDTWEEILVTITRNKTRSILTAFGVFWGIFMLAALMGGAQGLQDILSRQFQGFATNSGFIATMNTGKAYKGFQQGRAWDMENSDVERVKNGIAGVDIVTSTLARWGINIVRNEHKQRGTLKGHYPEYIHIEEPDMLMGRTINDIDIQNRRKVCIIGKQIYESLFPEGGDVCGKQIEIDGIYYQVIGVDVASGNMSVNGRAETSVVIPFTTMQKSYNYGERITMMGYTAKKGVAISEIEKDIASIVKQAHSIHPDDEQALMQLNAEALFGMMDNLFKGIRILGWLVGLGTLLAGAIGVSNIMMVTVKERTAEIGIRRAIGASPKDILQQILSESMVLTTIAGMAGITFAVLLLDAVENGVNASGQAAHFQISFWEAIGACLLLLLLGLMAGLAPAYRAMAIKPIEAIRDE